MGNTVTASAGSWFLDAAGLRWAFDNTSRLPPGGRHGSVSDFADCTTPHENKPEKSLLVRLKRKGGRNNQGVTCVRFRGGGHKRMYRLIDFKRKKPGVAQVLTIEYDPNRSARIALVQYPDGEKRYILAPGGLEGRDDCREQRSRRAASRQLHAAAEDPAGH